MIYQGTLKKMGSTLVDGNVHYTLLFGDYEKPLNELIGRRLSFKYLNKIYCVKCGNRTNKSYGQGFCFPCFQTAPEAEPCVIHPELCKAHEGVARNMEYATKNCLTSQYVYLSRTANIKVGVTRESQIPTRWIDQGAVEALIIAKTPNRYTAGVIESLLKNYFSDKTDWQKMLKNTIDQDTDLYFCKNEAIDRLPSDYKIYTTSEQSSLSIRYPVQKYPVKPKTLDFTKTVEFSDILVGIKGQYLIFENDTVINIRKHNGFLVNIELF